MAYFFFLFWLVHRHNPLYNLQSVFLMIKTVLIPFLEFFTASRDRKINALIDMIDLEDLWIF